MKMDDDLKLFTQNRTNRSDFSKDGSNDGFFTFCWSLIITNCLSVILNVTVAKMLIKFRLSLLRSTSNRILLSLNIADAFVSCFGVTLGVTLLTRQPLPVYKIAGTLPLFGSMFVSMTSLAILTTDRLMAIKMSLRYRSQAYMRAITRLILVSWTVPMAITLSQIMIYIYTDTNTELKIRGGMLVAFFITSAVTLTVTNCVLVFSLKRHNSILNENELESIRHLSVTSIQSSNAIPEAITVPITRPELQKSSTRTVQWETFGNDIHGPRRRSMVDELGQDSQDENECKVGCIARNTEHKDISDIPEEEEAVQRMPQKKEIQLNTGFNVQLNTPEQLKQSPVHHIVDSADVTDRHTTPSSHNKKPRISFADQNSIVPHRLSNAKTNGFIERTVARQRARSIARSKTETKATIMCACIVAIFIICWMPLTIYRLVYAADSTGIESPWFRRFALCLASSNSLLNPCAYLLVRKDFRRYLLQVCSGSNRR